MTAAEALSPKQAAKQEAILAAALHLFTEKGFHGTAVPDVAVLAGVATGTIYRYFASKEALVNAVFQHAKRALRDALDMADFQPDQPARPLFHRLWQRLTGFARSHPLEFRFLELHDHVPYLDERSRAIEQEVLVPIWAYCVLARSQGVARPLAAEALMALIWGAFVGLVKAEHSGYLTLTDATLAAAEDACWACFSCVPDPAGADPDSDFHPSGA